MDHFGIGAAIAGAIKILLHSARQTGRTTSLLDSVKDGDRIIFNNHNECRRVKHMLEDRGLSVECRIIPVKEIRRLFETGTPQGRTIFDHSWVEEFYLNAIEHAQMQIAEIQIQTSGYGEKHRETRRKAEEIARWRI